MRRIAAVSTFLLLAGLSTSALADIPPEKPKRSGEKKNCSVNDENGGMLGLAIVALLASGKMVLRRRSQ